MLMLKKYKPQKISFWNEDNEGFIQNEIDFELTLWKYSTKSSDHTQITIIIKKNVICMIRDGAKPKYRSLDFEFLSENKVSDKHNYPYYICLQISKFHKMFYHHDANVIKNLYNVLSRYCILQTFIRDFDTIRVIGQGFSSVVHLVREKKTNILWAAKSIPLSFYAESKDRRKALSAEIKFYRELKHPGIVKFGAVYEHQDSIWIITEYLRGGNLFQRLKSNNRLHENEAAMVIKKLFDILIYLESNQIIHRDIKLNNLMLADENDFSSIKLIDFGLACKLEDLEFKHPCGTPGTIAPEVICGKNYDYKADIFSAGVVLYTCLCGHLPFVGKTTNDTFRLNFIANIEFDKHLWQNISTEAKELILWLLSPSPKYRAIAAEALCSDWLVKYFPDLQNSSIIKVKNRNYSTQSKLNSSAITNFSKTENQIFIKKGDYDSLNSHQKMLIIDLPTDEELNEDNEENTPFQLLSKSEYVFKIKCKPKQKIDDISLDRITQQFIQFIYFQKKTIGNKDIPQEIDTIARII